MEIGICMLCRSTSSRLPKKHLKLIRGRAVLGHIYDRVMRGAPGCSIVVATSIEETDEELVDYCRRSNIECFRGALKDVADRFVACAKCYGWDFIVRINGDNLFADPDTIRAMIAIAKTDAYDFITNVPGRTFPYGMTVEILRVSYYEGIMTNIHEPKHREHVTSWFYQHEHVGSRFTYVNTHLPEAGGVQLALDTEEDLARSISIMNNMDCAPSEYSLVEVVQLAMQSTSSSPWKGQCGPLLIAEIGGNHEGKFETAKKLVEQAIATGIDFVKFQLYRADTLVSPIESPDRHAHFKRFELTREENIELAKMCQNAGVGYLASVWDLAMLEWIDPYMAFYKVGSGDLTNWPLVRELARRGKPIILSTGLATLDDVLQTVAQMQMIDDRYKKPEWLCILQCTSMYPIQDKDANLRVMDTFRQATGLAVGYSDHTEGGCALRAAAAMGAQVLEFHFTDDREGKHFRDHKVSLTPDEVKELKGDLCKITTLRGHATKAPEPIEIQQGHVDSFRRSVYLRRTVESGETITRNDLVMLRPNHGVDARKAFDLIGRKALIRLEPYKKFSLKDIV